jgi:hypothetical protein
MLALSTGPFGAKTARWFPPASRVGRARRPFGPLTGYIHLDPCGLCDRFGALIHQLHLNADRPDPANG